jgi:hypothetical protein
MFRELRSRATDRLADERRPSRAGRVADRTGDRGQTVHDYAIGMSVFLLTVAFAFALIPSLFAPFTAPIDDGLTARADRAAAHLVGTLSADANELDPGRTADRFEAGNATASALRDALALPPRTGVNVTVTDPATGGVATVAGTELSAGEPVGDRPTAASSRIVSIADDPYRLTVYLW